MLWMAPGYSEAGNDGVFGAIKYNYDANLPFHRTLAPLHIIVISDESDQSIHVDTTQVFNAIRDYQRDHNSVVTYSAITHISPAWSECNGSAEFVGSDYIRLALALGGNVIDICREDWTDAMNDIAHLSVELDYEFFLNSLPKEETIMVYVEDGPITLAFDEGDWTYDYERNSITFTEFEPENHQVIVVEYTINSI
jgi:hypothetical protein